MHPRDKYTIPNLRNACRVLMKLADFPDGLDLRTISQDLDIPRTTALRICSTLERENLLTRNSMNKFILGSSLAPLGMRALPHSGLREMAVPVLSELTFATQETSHLAVLCGKKALILEVCDSPHLLRVASRPGSLAYIHCSATGKIFLAWGIYIPLEKFMDGVELESRTPKTITTIEHLQKEIAHVKEVGFAVDDEEFALGVRCVAAPVWDIHKHVIAAVGITAAAVRFTKDQIEQNAEMATAAAEKLSKLVQERQSKET